MSLVITHKGITLSAECSEEYNKIVQGLFGLISADLDQGALIKDGTKIPFGWTEFRVKLVDDVFVLEEPDFFEDPATTYRSDLDYSLGAYKRQRMFIGTLEIGRWEPVSYLDTIAAEKDAIEASRIVAKRLTDPEGVPFWLVCKESTVKTRQEISLERLQHDFEQIPVWHLVGIRPALFDALALPRGFQALIEDNQIVEVVNDEGDHWRLGDNTP